MTHADGYFAIGKAHTVCQDYVRHGLLPSGRAYAIVSDGCSGSKDTDIGARILVLEAEKYIRSTGMVVFSSIARQAHSVATAMGLPEECLDATLLIAVDVGSDVLFYQMGDGVVAGRNRDGSMDYVITNFTMGAPFYPSYLACGTNRLDSYLAFDANKVTTVSHWVNKPGGNPKEGLTYSTRDAMAWGFDYPVAIFPKSKYDLVVLMTDGAMSFRSGHDQISPVDIAEQVLDVKVPTGEFMIRRAKRFLGNYCAAKGWHHDDDFGVGAIFVEDEQT